MRVQILDLAKDDLIEGFHFYERKEEGLGRRFLASLYSDIESLATYGGVHRKSYRELHRALSKTFPFAIYYSVDQGVVRIRAIVDCRRSPSWIRRHLREA
jgi:plasmid stabilization system protein ParE